MNSPPVTLKNEAEFESLTSTGRVLVDFYADWCEPCKWLDPILDELSETMSSPFIILKVNTDEYHSITHRFNIRSVPVLLFFIDNQVVWRMNGFKTAKELMLELNNVSREMN